MGESCGPRGNTIRGHWVKCCVLCLVTQSCPTVCNPMTIAHQAPLSMGILQARILEWVAMPSSRGSSQRRDRTRSPALQVDSLPAEQPGKSHQVTVYFKQPLEGSHANFLPNAEMSSKTPLKDGNWAADGATIYLATIIARHCVIICSSLVAQSVENLPAMWETWVQSLGWEDPLEEGMATHSSILAWRISMDRGVWWATVHEVTKSLTQLKD